MTQSQERKMDTGEAVGQQWSNIHIENYACNVSENYAEQIRIGNSMKMLRNEYEATIATQAAKITELELERVTLWHTVNTQAELIEKELAAQRAAQGASVPSEVLEAMGYCWRWAQVWSEKGGADSDERYAFMNKQVDIVVDWLAQQRGQG